MVSKCIIEITTQMLWKNDYSFFIVFVAIVLFFLFVVYLSREKTQCFAKYLMTVSRSLSSYYNLS